MRQPPLRLCRRAPKPFPLGSVLRAACLHHTSAEASGARRCVRGRLHRHLGGDWLELEDDQGRVYYANAITRQTSWVRPGTAVSTRESVPPLQQYACARVACAHVVNATIILLA